MGVNSCMICDDRVADHAIDEELAKGLSYVALARLMTLRGFEVSASTISQHDKHRAPAPPPGVAKTKRDIATLVRDRVAHAIENLPEPSEDSDMLDLILAKDLQPAIKSGLAAQALLDKREARTDDRRVAFVIATLLAGGSPAGFIAPQALIGEGEDEEDDDAIIEGHAVEVVEPS